MVITVHGILQLPCVLPALLLRLVLLLRWRRGAEGRGVRGGAWQQCRGACQAGGSQVGAQAAIVTQVTVARNKHAGSRGVSGGGGLRGAALGRPCLPPAAGGDEEGSRGAGAHPTADHPGRKDGGAHR